ncbi:hypothetical protein HU200_011347 [Digitaria exilis]|uniref:Uncharacterized protein n=1 Tax=Digitaria exilis TaxID=1010633 RepID=A0A835KLF4_9POAL|nr:hypothetical protein HU200_011347 [Digitaria exilis]
MSSSSTRERERSRVAHALRWELKQLASRRHSAPMARAALSFAALSYAGRPVGATCARPVGGRGRRRCGLMVVRAGGPPSTNVLILAFVLPLSLFVGTLVTAARVADDLDERFLREMEINKAILEENEAESDEDSEFGEGEEEEEDDEQAQSQRRKKYPSLLAQQLLHLLHAPGTGPEDKYN